MKKVSLFALVAAMSFGAMHAAQDTKADAPCAQTKSAPVKSEAKAGFVTRAFDTAKDGVSATFNATQRCVKSACTMTKEGIWLPYGKNRTFANLGKTVFGAAAVYFGYKAVKAVSCNEDKCCVSRK